MESNGYSSISDVKRLGNEISEFPMICETCLGDNPFIRMMKDHIGKECKICARPFTLFRWKPGAKARYKQTIICQSCAKIKNVCQTCLFDLQYGLPVQVRDQILNNDKLDIPISKVNSDYFNNQLERISQQDSTNLISAEAKSALNKLAKLAPYYRRNMPRVCTFWLKGECNRGSECPYAHENYEHDPSISNQNIRDRYSGDNDILADKILRRHEMNKALQAPVDKTITTLCVSGLTTNVLDKDESNVTISEESLKSHFTKYGKISALKIIPKLACAFITYGRRSDAEQAIFHSREGLALDSIPLNITWARSQFDNEDCSSSGKRQAIYPSMLPQVAERY